MSIKKLLDKAGTTLTVVDVDGYHLPIFNSLKHHEEDLRSMSAWQARYDDLMICAYPKSGTHWLWVMVSMLITRKTNWINEDKETAMVDLISKETHDNMKSPRVLNSHMYLEYLPQDFFRRRCKVIYLMRNPKDVTVSFFNHHRKRLNYDFAGTWEDYVPRYLKGDVDYGSWFDYTLKWEKFMEENPEYPICVTTFEDMKEDTLREVTRIAKYLDVNCDQAFLQKVADLCQFEHMKNKHNTVLDGGWKGNVPMLYRKGEVGDWKNWFTVAQSELFDRVYQERMKYSKVQPIYTI